MAPTHPLRGEHDGVRELALRGAEPGALHNNNNNDKNKNKNNNNNNNNSLNSMPRSWSFIIMI
jgi:hypothetical protein